MDEAPIIARLDEGDVAGAATEALRLYGQPILGYLHSVARNEADAGEIFSMFCEDLWTGLPQFRRESSFRTWAYKLAWHAAMRFFKDPYRKRAQPLASEEFSRLAQAVRTTTAAHLRIDRGMPWQEIAEIMSESGERPAEAALRKRFERLKEKLRKLAQDEGLIPR